MKSKLLQDLAGQKTFALVFQTGDEVMSDLKAFAKSNHLAGSHLTAIGAFQDVTLGYFDWQSKKYQKIPVHEQVEVVSLVGDVAKDEKGDVQLHVHVVIGKSDGAAMGGHLIEAHVRPTLEVILVELPAHLQRRHDQESGLALIRL